MRQKIATLALAVALVALVASRPIPEKQARAGNGDNALVSQSNDSAYAPDTNFQAFRSTISVVDTLTTTNILSLPAFQVQNRTTLQLGIRFTNPGATVGLTIACVWRHPSATSDTDVTSRTFSWKQATWTPAWPNTSYTVASNVIKAGGNDYSLTAGTQQWEGSYYKPTTGDLFIDTERSSTLRILVTTAPSSGSVSFWCGS